MQFIRGEITSGQYRTKLSGTYTLRDRIRQYLSALVLLLVTAVVAGFVLSRLRDRGTDPCSMMGGPALRPGHDRRSVPLARSLRQSRLSCGLERDRDDYLPCAPRRHSDQVPEQVAGPVKSGFAEPIRLSETLSGDDPGRTCPGGTRQARAARWRSRYGCAARYPLQFPPFAQRSPLFKIAKWQIVCWPLLSL